MMKKTLLSDLSRKAVFAMSMATVLIFPVQHAQAQLLRLVTDFEDALTGSLIQSGNMPVPSQLVARNGGWSLRAYLDRRNSPSSYRTEVEVLGNQRIGQVSWTGISIYLPESHVKSDIWESVFQMHDRPNDWSNAPSGREPVLIVGSDQGIGGQWRIMGKYNSAYNGGGNTQKTAFDASVGRMHAGWNDFVFNWRWAHSEGQGGFTKIWIDGQLVIDHTGPNAFNDDLGPYTKFGIYKGWRDRYSPADSVQTRLVYFDEYREAGPEGSYEAVAPRGGVSQAARPKPPILSIQ